MTKYINTHINYKHIHTYNKCAYEKNTSNTRIHTHTRTQIHNTHDIRKRAYEHRETHMYGVYKYMTQKQTPTVSKHSNEKKDKHKKHTERCPVASDKRYTLTRH